MGFLLLLFLMIEIALLVITFTNQKEKKQWLRNRVIARMGEIAIFLLALLMPQVAWDFRFKMCFFLLVIRVVTALVSFVMKREKVAGNKSKFGAVVNAVLGILILTVSLVPAMLFTGYAGLETTGTYGVKETSAILVDESRIESFETDGSKREIPVHFYYPETENANENSFPLVIFSHGAFGYYQSNTSTYMELASHGYVVISLDHPYHSFFTEDTNGKLITVNPEFLQEVMYINQEGVPEEEIFSLSQKWLKIRIEDMNFVLDSVKDIKASGKCSNAWFFKSDVEEEILRVLAMTDAEKIGLMGHSMGGATSVTVGRTRNDIDAVIDLDGTMLGEQLKFENGEYTYYDGAYPAPLLVVDNEEHHLQGDELGVFYVNGFVLENAPVSENTYIPGTGHMNYTDLPLLSPFLASLLGTGTVDETECIIEMNEMVLGFFNTYLKGTN